jgi:FlaA1/EpsC-like NDP-sugar epimerase
MKQSRPYHALDEALNWMGRHVAYRRFIVGVVFILSAASFWLSFELRFDFHVPQPYADYQLFLPLLVALLKTFVFVLLGGHTSSWRYAGIRDAERLLLHNLLCTGILWGLCFADGFSMVRRGSILIDFLMSSLLIGGFQLGLRLFRERFLITTHFDSSSRRKRAIIFGAGDGGEMIAREVLRNQDSGLKIKAFFDDDPAKHGITVHGIPVKGGLERAPHYVEENNIDMAIVAIPSANNDQMRRIHEKLRALQISIKTLPPLVEIIRGAPSITQLRDINIADLLGRKEVRIDNEQVAGMIYGNVVLVTGAGGSIGSELCRQILQRGPAKLLLVERSENSLFHLHRHLMQLSGSTSLVPILCDITDEQRVFEEFRYHRPDLVFHAAAHKHVPLQELHPAECFRNNVGGTRSVARASSAHGVKLFVMISTDKAVNPTSVMGATKRACEILCQAFAHESETKFVSVRFGNVLGSDGSVVPIFLEQIARGGPITVTHPEMRRYFMTIPEAVTLVLQAAAIGQSGQVLVLDMGHPIKIVDLAHQLIQLVDRSPSEIPIEYVGTRPGEKLFEELSCNGEACSQTSHNSIWIFDENGYRGRRDVEAIECALREVCEKSDISTTRKFLMQIVPEYAPENYCSRDIPHGIKALAANN